MPKKTNLHLHAEGSEPPTAMTDDITEKNLSVITVPGTRYYCVQAILTLPRDVILPCRRALNIVVVVVFFKLILRIAEAAPTYLRAQRKIKRDEDVILTEK